jgi:hypothetical protein
MRTEPSSPRQSVLADSASWHIITTLEESAGTAVTGSWRPDVVLSSLLLALSARDLRGGPNMGA